MPFVILLIVAALLIAGGFGSLLVGTDSVLPDRPLIAGLGGIIAIVGGCLLAGMAFVQRELRALRAEVTAMAEQSGDAADRTPARSMPGAVAEVISSSEPPPSIRPALASAGALAAVAAAVGATAVVTNKEAGENSGSKSSDPAFPPSPPAMAETAQDPADPLDDFAAMIRAEAEKAEDAIAEDIAPPAELIKDMTVPKALEPLQRDTKPNASVALDSLEAELALESDPFNLQAEFDRLLDQTAAGPETAEATAAAGAANAPNAADKQDDAEPERDLLKEEEFALTDNDKSELEDLVRSAIQENEQEAAAEKSFEEFVPEVPPVETLRDRIASAIEATNDPATVENPEPEMPAVAAVVEGAEEIKPLEDISAEDMKSEAAIEQDVALPPAPEPELPPPAVEMADEPPPRPEPPARTIVRTFSSGANQYTMYTDGSISADTPSGRYEFASFDELRAFIDTYKG